MSEEAEMMGDQQDSNLPQDSSIPQDPNNLEQDPNSAQGPDTAQDPNVAQMNEEAPSTLDESMDTAQQSQVEQNFEPATQQGADEKEVPYDDRKIFVGGLSWETSDAKLREYFGNHGEVVDVKIKIDPDTNKSRGFAFVVFSDSNIIDEVVSKEHSIDGRAVDVKKAIPHAIHQAMKNRTKKIFVGGVPVDMPEDTISNYFKQFGEIEEVALVTDKGSKKRRGFCFVEFTTEEAVDICTEKTFHQLETTQVEVKRATPRDQSYGMGGRGRGRGRGGFGRSGWMPYGQYGGYGPGGGGGFGGYGGGFDPNFGYHHPGEFYGGGGGGGGYGGYGGRGGGGPGQGFGSRYGPMKGSYGHASGGAGYHPYSR